MSESTYFRWLGVGGIEIKAGDQIVTLDPFFSRPPWRKMWYGRVTPNRDLIAKSLRHCDFILVTHAHWDHLMDVPDVLRNTGAIVVGSRNTCKLLKLSDISINQMREVNAGDLLQLGNFKIKVFTSEHGKALGRSILSGPLPHGMGKPTRIRDYIMDTCFSYLIDDGSHRFFDAAGLRTEEASSADVLFVGPNGTFSDYESLLQRVSPKVVVPVHWDNMFRPLAKSLQPMLEPPKWAFPPFQHFNFKTFADMLKRIAPGTEVIEPELNRSYLVDELV